MSLLALQLVAVGGVTALKPSRGARRCAVALKPVSMAGAGKKPKDEDNKPPRGFPRCVPGAPPASVRTPRVAIHTPRLARASRRRPGIAKARRPVAVVRFLFRWDRRCTFHAAFARDGRDSRFAPVDDVSLRDAPRRHTARLTENARVPHVAPPSRPPP